MRPVIEMKSADVRAPGGRPLFLGLTLRLGRERVALVGRNGVGKSMLLAVLAGECDVSAGRVRLAGRRCFVPQEIAVGARSHGEARRRALEAARVSGADLLLLDEPTEDLDDASVAWLRGWLDAWPGALVVASHDRRLLADFRDFFVASESGSRLVHGTLDDVDAALERDHEASERRYVQGLNRLATFEAHTARVARRRARKKRYGRCRELDRGTPKIRLNQKRDYAQVKHGRMAKIRAARLDAIRQWVKSSRRALRVSLALDLPSPAIVAGDRPDAIVAHGVSAVLDGRRLFGPLDVRVGARRVALVGPNGAGKTTLLEILLGRRAPTTGFVTRDLARVGVVAQGASDWCTDESLLAHLALERPADDDDARARLLVAHRFPLALAERPLRTLSPGERTRAALVALFHRAPAIDALVLDEPTRGLDLVGQRALARALGAWPGGLVVASHDRAFLDAIGIDATIAITA